jgi:mycofactocin glycosyltransferase
MQSGPSGTTTLIEDLRTGMNGFAITISIVICSKDRRKDVEHAVTTVRRSGMVGAQAEIIVVEETDRPETIPGVQYVALPRQDRGFGYARNRALRTATGSILMFIDDDCEAEQGWAEALLVPFQEDSDVLGVAGAIAVQDCGLIGYAENILGFPGGGLQYAHHAKGHTVPTRHLSTCNCAYRKDVLERVGGFSEEARAGSEDALIAERVAALGPCRYTPHAVVYHRTRDRLSAVARWFMRRGYSEMASIPHRVGKQPFLSYLIRSSWTLRVGVMVLLAVWSPPLCALAPQAFIVYYLAMLWRYRFAREYPTHRAAWWVVPFVKMAMDLGNEVGRWKHALARQTI